MDDHLDSLAHSELRVSPPPEPKAHKGNQHSAIGLSTHTRPRSPPLAPDTNSNDALAPPDLLSQSSSFAPASDPISLSPLNLPDMSRLHSPAGDDADMRLIVERQAEAINKLHGAFAAERDVWRAERESMNRRIVALEQLLKTRDHHSPAKSPVTSPSVPSPHAHTHTTVKRLPSIAEDENSTSLSLRRDAAPKSLKIDLSSSHPVVAPPRRASAVSFTYDENDVKVDEVPISPPQTAMPMSPLPDNNRANAGHTPLRIPTPPLTNIPLDGGVEDTPTRNNTHINSFLTKLHAEDVHEALKGPLNMPELPNRPDETNFTLEALSRRLEQVAQSPDADGKPAVLIQPSPGRISPIDRPDEISPGTVQERTAKGRREPNATQNGETSVSDLGSTTLSPQLMSELSPQESHEMKIHHDFEHGGIKLKKKPSINFGQPLGQLSGFGRKLS